MSKPVLELVRLRVDEGGVPQIDGLSMETSGDRVLVLSGPSALFRAAAGALPCRHGELRTDGLTVAQALREAKVAGAPLDPALPGRWTVREYVTWSARLAGRRDGDERALIDTALGGLKLEALTKAKLRDLPLAARRALSVAAALATGATTLFLEDPLRGLTEDAARSLARLLVRATDGRRTVVFAARTSLASPLAMDADEAIVLDGSTVVGQGAPAEVAAHDRSYRVRLYGPGASFAELATSKGARLVGEGTSWTIDLGDSLRVTDILDVAMASGTVVLELHPVAHAFG